VRDSAAEWALARGALDVDVDPLAVARALGKRVDALLVHAHPLRHAELPPDEALDRGERQRVRHG
jgi:hypothetical protein